MRLGGAPENAGRLTAGIADAEIADHPFSRREVFVVDKGGATIPAEAEVELWAEVQRGLDGPNAEGLLKEPVMVLVAAISPVPLLGLWTNLSMTRSEPGPAVKVEPSQEDLHQPAASRVDALVEEDRLADIELGLGCAGESREGIGIDGGSDPHLVGARNIGKSRKPNKECACNGQPPKKSRLMHPSESQHPDKSGQIVERP